VDSYFVSFDGKDRNIAALFVDALRRHNTGKRFFWTGDSLVGGKGWFHRIERALANAKGVVCLITNNQSGTNNWINLEVGAAIGGRKRCILIIAPGISCPAELSRPLQELQYLVWSDRIALRRELKRTKLAFSRRAVEDLVAVFEPPRIISCMYGEGENWHTYTNAERRRFSAVLENQKEIVIGNHLIGNHDPSPGNPKVLRIEVERASERYFKSVDEGAMLRRGDLW
jgi:hypothetical protein